jgi:hypothetical protein
MRLIFVFLLSCALIFAKAQNNKTKRTLVGDIYAKQQSVAYARVYIQSKTQIILGYAFADEHGHFSIEYSTGDDSVYVNISRIGYAKKQLIISSTRQYLKTELSVSEQTEFKEITVVADKKAITERGDTVSYAVNKFTDGTEVNAEDILAKLPGVSVDKKSGKIKYQGKEIKKILLDGDDLTDNNYKVLSKNLAADWLEEVDILRHFTDSRLYHGIKKSDEVAINIKLKKEAKAPLFGTLEAGVGGWDKLDKYLARAELLSYLKKLKIFAHAESSNTGIDVEAYDMEGYMSNNLEYKGFISSKPYLNDQLSAPDFFKEEQFTFNQGHFLSNSMIYKPNEKTRIKSLTTLFNNKQNYDFSNRLVYLFPELGNSSLTERQIQDQFEFELFQDIKIEHQISKSQDFNTRIQIKKNFNELNTQNYADSLNDLASLSKTDNTEMFAAISYINKFADKWVLTSDFEAGFEYLDEDLQFDSLNTQSSVKGIQNTTQKYFNLGFSSKLDGILFNDWYTSVSLAWLRTQSGLSAHAQSFADWNYNWPNKNYLRNNFYAEVFINKKIKCYKFSFGTRFKNPYINYESKQNAKVLIEPTISFIVDKTFADLIKLNLKLLSNIEYLLTKPFQLIGIPLFVNYRTINSFEAYPFQESKHNFNVASITIRENRKTNISANAKWMYIVSDNILTDNISYPSNLEFNQKIQGGNTTEFVSMYALDKYFSFIKSSIKISYNYDIISSPLSINNYSSTNLTKISTFSVSSGTSLFNRKANLSLAFNQNNISGIWNNETNSLKYRNYFVKLRVNLTKNISWWADYNAIEFEHSGNYVFLLNSVMKINTTKKKFSYTLKCNNILNKESVEIINLNPTMYSATIYPLQGRFLLAAIKYKF